MKPVKYPMYSTVHSSIVIITEVLEEENDDSDPEVIKKARHYYQGCIDEGEFTTYIHLSRSIWLKEKSTILLHIMYR